MTSATITLVVILITKTGIIFELRAQKSGLSTSPWLRLGTQVEYIDVSSESCQWLLGANAETSYGTRYAYAVVVEMIEDEEQRFQIVRSG